MVPTKAWFYERLLASNNYIHEVRQVVDAAIERKVPLSAATWERVVVYVCRHEEWTSARSLVQACLEGNRPLSAQTWNDVVKAVSTGNRYPDVFIDDLLSWSSTWKDRVVISPEAFGELVRMARRSTTQSDERVQRLLAASLSESNLFNAGGAEPESFYDELFDALPPNDALARFLPSRERVPGTAEFADR